MTLSMLEALRADIARVDLSLVSINKNKDGRKMNTQKCTPRSNEFLKLRIKVTNLSGGLLLQDTSQFHSHGNSTIFASMFVP